MPMRPGILLARSRVRPRCADDCVAIALFCLLVWSQRTAPAPEYATSDRDRAPGVPPWSIGRGIGAVGLPDTARAPQCPMQAQLDSARAGLGAYHTVWET